MGKVLNLATGGPRASTDVLTKDPVVQPMMDKNAERLECEPILDVMRSTRDLIKHVIMDIPLQTWKKVKDLTLHTLSAPFLKTFQIATNIKNAVHIALGGSMAVLETAFTPIAVAGETIKKIKPAAA